MPLITESAATTVTESPTKPLARKPAPEMKAPMRAVFLFPTFFITNGVTKRVRICARERALETGV